MATHESQQADEYSACGDKTVEVGTMGTLLPLAGALLKAGREASGEEGQEVIAGGRQVGPD